MIVKPLLNSSASPSMNVNGSSTAVPFAYYVPAAEDYRLYSISIFVNDNDTFTPGDFAAITGQLTNGLLIQYQSYGVLREIAVIRNNMELMLAFRHDTLTSSTSGLLGTTGTFIGSIAIPKNVVITGRNTDFVRVIVRDNLTSVTFLRSSAYISREG